MSHFQENHLSAELIQAQLEKLLQEISSPEAKKLISQFFLQDVLSYENGIGRAFSELYKEKEYIFELEKRLEHLNTLILMKGYALELLINDKKVMQKVKECFRQLIGPWVYKGDIVKRGYEKPRGYPGDYMMLETVYNNKSLSQDVGCYFDNNFLKSPYAVAVRIRKDRLRDLLLDFINSSKNSTTNILDIACGSSREIFELLPNIINKNKITLSLLDWDEEALHFSSEIITKVKPQQVECKYIQEDVMSMTKEAHLADKFGSQDLIYSIGLIDYIPDRLLKKLIFVWYSLLSPAGRLVLTHKNREKTFPPLPPEWFCDWKFVPRNKEETIKLFYSCGISEFILSSETDEFDYIHYFTITKK